MNLYIYTASILFSAVFCYVLSNERELLTDSSQIKSDYLYSGLKVINVIWRKN
jgi:hypothetical protein